MNPGQRQAIRLQNAHGAGLEIMPFGEPTARRRRGHQAQGAVVAQCSRLGVGGDLAIGRHHAVLVAPCGVVSVKLRTFEGRDAKGGRSKNDEPNTREPKSGD